MKLYLFNSLSMIVFFILAPTIFRALNFAFIWHSIYWGVITVVILIWGLIILISPLFGRIGSGWIYFLGTIQDFTGQQSKLKIKWSKPKIWYRIIITSLFFTSAFTFLVIHLRTGMVTQIRFNPWFFNLDFTNDYKHVWLYDSFGAVLFGAFFDKRWMCRNLCFMGAICSTGASFSRLIPVVDTIKCNNCRKYDQECLVKIPIHDYILKHEGLVTNSECLICGKCVDVCSKKAISMRFIWNREKYISSESSLHGFNNFST
jgi:ferredoxin-type protein NapH